MLRPLGWETRVVAGHWISRVDAVIALGSRRAKVTRHEAPRGYSELRISLFQTSIQYSFHAHSEDAFDIDFALSG